VYFFARCAGRRAAVTEADSTGQHCGVEREDRRVVRP
jgi:hypothetical protein